MAIKVYSVKCIVYSQLNSVLLKCIVYSVLFIVYSVKMIIDRRTVSAFKGAYRLQLYYHLSKAYVVCFVGSLTLTL